MVTGAFGGVAAAVVALITGALAPAEFTVTLRGAGYADGWVGEDAESELGGVTASPAGVEASLELAGAEASAGAALISTSDSAWEDAA